MLFANIVKDRGKRCGLVMFEAIYISTDKSQLLQDYWAMANSANFLYSKDFLSIKYNIPVHMLDVLVKDLGYAVLKEPSFLCYQCHEPHRYTQRTDLQIPITAETICSLCITSDIDNIIQEEYEILKCYVQNYYKIASNNQRKIRYQNTAEIIHSLTLLEMIFLYNIINEVEPNNLGELPLKAFSKFIYSESKNNNVIQSLIEKGLLSHPVDEEINKRLVDLYFLCNHYKSEIQNQQTLKICDEVIKKSVIPTQNYILWKSNLIWRPSECSFQEFSDLLLIKIDKHRVVLKDLEQINIYLKQKRYSEVLFLSEVMEYNHQMKMKKSNAFISKSKELSEHYNIKMIYGYFMASMDLSLITLDHLPEMKRYKLKNSLYSNYFTGNKVKSFYEKNMPSNYAYSSNILFLENKYQLGNIWLEISVNDFIGLLINKVNI